MFEQSLLDIATKEALKKLEAWKQVENIAAYLATLGDEERLKFESWKKEDFVTECLLTLMMDAAAILRTREIKGGDAVQAVNEFQCCEDIPWLLNHEGV